MRTVMDLHQIRYALLKLTLFLMLGTTWVFSSFIFATRPDDSATDSFSSLVRLPASLPSQLPAIAEISRLNQTLPGVFLPAPKLNEPIEMNTVKVGCWDGKDRSVKSTSARWIRLTGKTCQGHHDADQVVVRNLTNGYTATVFPNHASGLSTDFIPLQAGRNEIWVRFNQGPGLTVESQFTFQRE